MGKFHDHMEREMQIRGFSPRTQESYLWQMRKFVRKLERPPDQVTLEDVNRYLVWMANDSGVAASTANQGADGGLRRRSSPIRDLAPQGHRHRQPFGELRAVSLSNRQQRLLRVEQGKGKKDRYVMLPERLLETLREYWKQERPRSWLFPGADPAKPLHPTALQKAFHLARLTIRLNKPVSVHSLRHSFATHLLQSDVHCVVTGGGLHPAETRWVHAKPRFLFAVRILSRLFRAKLLRRLELTLEKGKFRIDKGEGHALLRRAATKNWHIYSKPPFAGPRLVLSYLARYTHRIAISNHRLLSLDEGRVTFRWRDRADGDRTKTMTLEAKEFLRRFLLHVVPCGFMRVRHYGLLANASRKTSLERCRALLDVPVVTKVSEPEPWQALVERLTGRDPEKCPRCRTGKLVVCETLPSLRIAGRPPPHGARP